MQTLTVSASDLSRCGQARAFKVPEVADVKRDLAREKDRLDIIYKIPAYRQITGRLDPFRAFRRFIASSRNVLNPSNAWLKMYEIICVYDLLPKGQKTVHFDNAGFPGSFVLAAYHHATTYGREYEWWASSLYDRATHGDPLEDSYHLFRNYPDHWLMTDTNNGNVLILDNLLDWKARLGGKVTLYTSDLGFDVSVDWNKQEELHAGANLGQILAGLMMLKEGGSLVTKQYTFFEPFTLSMIAVVATCFDRLDIFKPETSRVGNSEVYLVGIGFKGMSPEIEQILSDRLAQANPETGVIPMTPFIPRRCFGAIEQLLQFANTLYRRQIQSLDNMVATYEAYKDSPQMADFRDVNRRINDAWLERCPVKTIPSAKNLRVLSVVAVPQSRGGSSRGRGRSRRGRR